MGFFPWDICDNIGDINGIRVGTEACENIYLIFMEAIILTVKYCRTECDPGFLTWRRRRGQEFVPLA